MRYRRTDRVESLSVKGGINERVLKIQSTTQVNADAGIQWLFSFLSADEKKTYCLYEAPNLEAIRDAARKLNLPADIIVELGDQRFNPASPSLFSPTRG
jgi:hypothetical protein